MTEAKGNRVEPGAWWRPALLGCALFAAVPVLVSRYLPIQDYPQHLLMAQVLTHLEDPAFDFADHFETDLRLRPYLGGYGVAILSGGWLSADAALKLSFVIYLVLTPLSVLAYVREIEPGRGPAAFLASAAVWNGLYHLGFLNFLMALPGVFVGLAAALAFTRTPGWRSGAVFVGAAVYSYLCHAAGFAMLLLTAGIYALLASGASRRRLLLLTAAIGLVAMAVTPLPPPPEGGLDFAYSPHGTMRLPQNSGRPFYFFSPITSSLYLLAFMVRDSTLWDAALWGIPAAALLATGWYARGTASTGRARRERWVLPALSLLLLYVVPGATPSIDYVNFKFTAFFFLSLAGLVPVRWLDQRTAVTLFVFAAATQWYALMTHLRFDAEARQLDPILAEIPAGAPVFAIILEPMSSTLLWSAPFTHIGYRIQAEKGGVGAPVFQGPQIPVKTKGPSFPVPGTIWDAPR